MADMVLDWRSLWGYDFPFYITQLAGFRPVTRVAGDDGWPGWLWLGIMARK